jgi:DNA sulfur modification protein DndB
MFVHVPAMRGKMGGRTYYSCLMPMSAVPKLFEFTDWQGFPAEQREQRKLNEKWVPQIAKYITDNDQDYLFSSITASFKSDPTFTKIETGDEDTETAIGVLKISITEKLIINDGQHRCAGIREALQENPELESHSISVILFPYENLARVQQMFSDLNKNVHKTSKSLDVMYDKRDDVSLATMIALDRVPVFKELTEKEDISLKMKSTKIFTLAALYDANRELLRGYEKSPMLENADRLTEFWQEVASRMPDWGKVLKGQKSALELRAEKISAHSTVLRALGGLGSELMRDPNWRNRLAALEQIDWSKKNPDWENVCIVANSVVSNRQARAATKAYIKGKLGMDLTDGEQRSVDKVPA